MATSSVPLTPENDWNMNPFQDLMWFSESKPDLFEFELGFELDGDWGLQTLKAQEEAEVKMEMEKNKLETGKTEEKEDDKEPMGKCDAVTTGTNLTTRTSTGSIPPSKRRYMQTSRRKTGVSRMHPKQAAILRQWLFSPENYDCPYLTYEEKKVLAKRTGTCIQQVASWMSNARRRLWAPDRKRRKLPVVVALPS